MSMLQTLIKAANKHGLPLDEWQHVLQVLHHRLTASDSTQTIHCSVAAAVPTCVWLVWGDWGRPGPGLTESPG